MSETIPAYRGRVKYTETTARRYQTRKRNKHLAEMRLVRRGFGLIPLGTVLDAPCGGGRVSLELAPLGYQITSADLALPMVEIARENVRAAGYNFAVVQEDVEKLSFPDRHFDSVVSFRLFHHFPTPEIRGRVIRELCRVAKRHVALSYFSPFSITSAKRRMRMAIGGRVSDKHQTPLAEVESYFKAAGFRLVQDFARMPLIHTLHLAVFERHGA